MSKSRNIDLRTGRLMREYIRQSNIKSGWKIMSKYTKYLSNLIIVDDHVFDDELKNKIKSNLEIYDRQFIRELKSHKIQYENSSYFNDWITTKNTILKSINKYTDTTLRFSVIKLSNNCNVRLSNI
jgi:uncharacterized protein (UPF0218 family)